jgi:hypothetical protein
VRLLVQRLALVSVGALVALTGLVGAAPADGAARNPREIVPGAIALGGSVTGPGLTKPRAITAENAGKFMQSWLAYSINGNPVIATPPKSAPVYRITVRQKFGGLIYNLKVLYATDATNAWVTMPAPQQLGWGAVTEPKWILAQSLTITAFHNAVGTLPPVSGAGSATTVAPRSASSDDGSSAWVWIVVAVAVLVAGATALGLRARRRRVPA